MQAETERKNFSDRMRTHPCPEVGRPGGDGPPGTCSNGEEVKRKETYHDFYQGWGGGGKVKPKKGYAGRIWVAGRRKKKKDDRVSGDEAWRGGG